MMEDVEAGKVSTVIVKDMSRFGRDYLKVGFYTEILFAEKDVRLIAVNDNVDTEHGENDFTPMMNIFNEWYVRSTSKKIRAVWQAKGKSGERLAVIPLTATAKTRTIPNSLSLTRKAPPLCAGSFGFPLRATAPRRLPGR
jgi:DNA invertase Pin-like site-specific DNA recombinase